jgi:hypothetical protein
MFDKKLSLNVDTIFCERKECHQIIHYFEDGVYFEAEVSDELVNETDNEIIGISKIKTCLRPKRVKELNANFPEKINAIDL